MTVATRLLLLGAGHAHLSVLRRFAERPWPGVALTLVTPGTRQLYSGRVPAWLAGHCDEADVTLPLAPLLAGGAIRHVDARVVALDAAALGVRLDDGRGLDADLISIDTGGEAAVDAIAGADRHAVPIKPFDRFAERWQVLRLQAARSPVAVAVIGGGAGGFELAIAMADGLRALGGPGVSLTLVTGADDWLRGQGERARQLAGRALERLQVERAAQRCAEVGAGFVVLDDGRRLPADLVVLATGSRPPRWLAASGLALDGDGWIATGSTLQSESHPRVLAAGDVATRIDARLPRSGVYAVRAGPALAANLERLCRGERPRPHHPSRRSLNLLACGSQRAIATWGRGLDGFVLTVEGHWVWRWKQAIDARFVAAQQAPLTRR